MIGTGYTTRLQLVQVLPDLRVMIIDGDPEWECWDVAQWHNPGAFFCECRDRGACDKSEVLWGTSDPYEPKFCTNHFFPAEQTGCEFYTVGKE
jgi:hypothetical protein